MFEISAEGVIRQGDPVVTLTGLALSEETAIEFCLFRSRQEVGRVIVNWPTDFVITDVEGSSSGSVILRKGREFAPYTSISISVGGRPVPLGPKWHLDRLYASTEQEFEKNFFRTKNRTSDRETLLFAASQIDEYYHINEAHRCVASVIKAYRAMDLADQEYCRESIDWLERQTGVFNQIGYSEHPRMDRSHLTVSVQFALAQLYLFVGRYDYFVKRLDLIVDYLRNSDGMFPGVIMNGCLSILLRCYLLAVEGRREEAVELSALNCDLYLGNLPRLARHAIWFKEMLLPHTAVYISLQVAEDAAAQRKLPSPLVVIRSGHRINYASAATIMERNFARLCRGLSRKREKTLAGAGEVAEASLLPAIAVVKTAEN